MDNQVKPDHIMIPLTQGLEAIVSPEDAYLQEFSWQVLVSPNGNRRYASRSIRKGGFKTTIKMHRVIAASMGISPCYSIRHKDGDGLNNRRSNIEVIHPKTVDDSKTFDEYVLSRRFEKIMDKSEIIPCIEAIIADGKIPTPELMAQRLGFQCYSHRPSLGVVRETVCFTELKDIFFMLPQQLTHPSLSPESDDDAKED